jgi:hypothetical protein
VATLIVRRPAKQTSTWGALTAAHPIPVCSLKFQLVKDSSEITNPCAADPKGFTGVISKPRREQLPSNGKGMESLRTCEGLPSVTSPSARTGAGSNLHTCEDQGTSTSSSALATADKNLHTCETPPRQAGPAAPMETGCDLHTCEDQRPSASSSALALATKDLHTCETPPRQARSAALAVGAVGLYRCRPSRVRCGHELLSHWLQSKSWTSVSHTPDGPPQPTRPPRTISPTPTEPRLERGSVFLGKTFWRNEVT